jgi:peptidoglycan-N-acetylglucosamine deacetylase
MVAGRKAPRANSGFGSDPIILAISVLMLSRSILCLCFLASVAYAQSADSQSPRDASQRPGPAATPSPSASAKVTYSSVHVDGPYIAMTFDDGPHATLTPKLLDLLAQKKIKVTFFVLGENVQRHPEILKRAAAEGHEIGNHSWSHPNLAKLSNEAVRSQLQRTDDVIAQAIGSHPKIMRPPYGELTPKQRQWVNSEFGYKVILWDVDPLDWKEPGPSIVAQRIIHETKPGSIMLSHDIHAQTITAMPATFDALVAKGFRFVTVSELLSLAVSSPPPQITPVPAFRTQAP